MPKASSQEMLDALKNSLRDLESVRMTAQDDPELLALKQQIRKMIERFEGAAMQIASSSGE
jgi:type VI protein secretion system component VasF